MTSLAAGEGEHLEDGHSPTTPPGDNLQLDFARGETLAYGALVAANGGRLHHDETLGLHLTDLGLPTPFANTAHLTRPLPDAAAPALVDTLRAFYASRDGGPFLLMSAWRTPDLRDFGFAPVGHPPLMFRPPGGDTITAPGLRIERARDAARLADFERTLIEAYPVPELVPITPQRFLHPAVLQSSWQFFVGYEGDLPVATAGAYVTDAMTMVELVSTRAECRGKGFGTAITAAATFAAPDRPALLISSDLGRGSYDRLGYLPMLRFTLWIGPR